MTARQIKMLTLMFALLNVWLLFRVPAFNDALLKFLTVGLVPGTTNTILSPNTMLYAAGGAFAVSVFLIFWREFRKLFRRQKAVQQPTPPMRPAEQIAAPIRSKSSKKTVAPVRRPKIIRVAWLPRAYGVLLLHLRRTGSYLKTQTARLVRSAWRFVSVAYAAMLPRAAALRSAARYFMKRAASQLKLAAIAFWRWAVPAAKRAWAFACRVVKTAGTLALAAWYWCEPRIRAFDNWLNVRLHRNQHTAGALKFGGELIASLTRDWRKLVRTFKTIRSHARKAWRTTDQA